MKITKEQIDLIKSSKNTNKQIALELNIPKTTVNYYRKDNRDKQRLRVREYFNKLPEEKKLEIYKKNRIYYKKWYAKNGKIYMQKYMEKRRCKNLIEKQ